MEEKKLSLPEIHAELILRKHFTDMSNRIRSFRRKISDTDAGRFLKFRLPD